MIAILLSNFNYKFLHSRAAQQTLRAVAESFQSYKELSYKHLAGEFSNKPQLIKYRKKGGLAFITYPKQALKLTENKVRVPLGKKVQAAFKVDSFLLNFPNNLDFKKIRKIRIIPRNNCFYVEWVYQLEIKLHKTMEKDKVIGIDRGLDNWLACLSNVGTSFIISGRHLKSVNQWYNKQVATIKDNKPQGFWSI
ncbi:transposase [Dapis sp. BLCC M229]|uniref:transposase n=1 Tax=Dapis sp. BLCC M229 TaxID=3400188 RepID=UPI003CE714B9